MARKNALQTLDKKKKVRHLTFQDADKAFFGWFENVVNAHVIGKDGEMKKVPVTFFSPERWVSARDLGIREKNPDGSMGPLIIPLIAIGRTNNSSAQYGTAGKHLADTKQPVTYYRKLDPKSQLVLNLMKEHPHSIDPKLPIYEVFSFTAPNHFACTYEVTIWTDRIEHMNSIMEQIGQAYDFNSVKSFQFKAAGGFKFMAFQQEEEVDQGNLQDFSEQERIVKKELSYDVPVYLYPKSRDGRENFSHSWTQTKVVVKKETVLSHEEFEKAFPRKLY